MSRKWLPAPFEACGIQMFRKYLYPLVYAFILWYLLFHLGVDGIREIMSNGYLR